MRGRILKIVNTNGPVLSLCQDLPASSKPAVQTGVTKAAYAAASSPQIADAAFAAPRGGVIGPVRGPLGWVVAKVDSVEH